MKARTAIETHPSGTFFDFAEPKPEDVHVEDIARSLSLQCRFGGHCERFYSIAEHALLVSRLVREAGHGVKEQFAALHHDSHEAYIGDIPTPLKEFLKAWSPQKFENLVWDLDGVIAKSLELHPTAALRSHVIKTADYDALCIEASVLKVSRGVGLQWGHSRTAPADVPTGAVSCMDSKWAEHMFLAAHWRLAGDAAMQRLTGGRS